MPNVNIYAVGKAQAPTPRGTGSHQRSVGHSYNDQDVQTGYRTRGKKTDHSLLYLIHINPGQQEMWQVESTKQERSEMGVPELEGNGTGDKQPPVPSKNPRGNARGAPLHWEGA